VKTHRIPRSIEQGVAFEAILGIAFTDRAARSRTPLARSSSWVVQAQCPCRIAVVCESERQVANSRGLIGENLAAEVDGCRKNMRTDFLGTGRGGTMGS
jgi:hypothetical protein